MARGRHKRTPRGRRPPRESGGEAVCDVTIRELAAGGDGVGRTEDGRVVFVPFTAPGDRVRVRIERERPRYARGRVEALLEPGPHRVDPVCAVFGTCGGCSWQHVDYPTQLAAKSDIVTNAFARIAGIRLPDRVPVVPSPQPYGYRGRARVLVQGGRVGFRRRRSGALCATRHCPVLVPALQEKLRTLGSTAAPDDGEWELFCADGEARAVALALPDGGRLELEAGDERIGISPGVFAQSNALLLDSLARAVRDAAGDGDLALELFAGAGFFTLGLARRFARVVALEADPAAVRDLRANAAAAGIANVEVIEERLEQAQGGGRLATLRPDVVVLDPPRTGLPRDAATAVAALGPDRIVYLACDPATQARDAAVFVGSGYALSRVRAFDLFPQTPHVESLAVFEREFAADSVVRVR